MPFQLHWPRLLRKTDERVLSLPYSWFDLRYPLGNLFRFTSNEVVNGNVEVKNDYEVVINLADVNYMLIHSEGYFVAEIRDLLHCLHPPDEPVAPPLP